MSDEVPLYQEIGFSLVPDTGQPNSSGVLASRAPTQQGTLSLATKPSTSSSEAHLTMGALSLLANQISDSDSEIDARGSKAGQARQLPEPVEVWDESLSPKQIIALSPPEIKAEPTPSKPKPKLQIIPDSPPPTPVTTQQTVKLEKKAPIPSRADTIVQENDKQSDIRRSPRRPDKKVRLAFEAKKIQKKKPNGHFSRPNLSSSYSRNNWEYKS